MSEDKETIEITDGEDVPTELGYFTHMLNHLNIPYHVQPDNTVVLTFRRIRFDMDGKRAKK